MSVISLSKTIHVEKELGPPSANYCRNPHIQWCYANSSVKHYCISPYRLIHWRSLHLQFI